MKKINIIVAMDAEYAIGHGEKIPWILADDFTQNFVPKTKGCPIIMGRKTAQTLKSPLKGRTNIVISRSKDLKLDEGFIIVEGLEKAIEVAEYSPGETIWNIGGAQIYNLLQNSDKFFIDEYHITYVDGRFESPFGIEEIIFIPNIKYYMEMSKKDFFKREPTEKNRGNNANFTVKVYSMI